jgi:hypothetical protein
VVIGLEPDSDFVGGECRHSNCCFLFDLLA